MRIQISVYGDSFLRPMRVLINEHDFVTDSGALVNFRGQLTVRYDFFSSLLTDIFIAIGVQCSVLHRQEGIYQPNDVVMVEPAVCEESFFV